MQTASVLPPLSRSSNVLCASEAHAAWYAAKSAENRARIFSRVTSRPDRSTRANCKLLERATPPYPNRSLIAVVDDEPVIAITLAEILMRHGFDAVWFSCPTETLNFFTSCGADLLLSDISMPTMDGITLASKILELTPECVVFLLSARSHEDELRRRVQLLSPNVHLEAKPVNVDELITIVRRMLMGH